MTDAAERAVGKRVSTRTTRTNAAIQERKDALQTLPALSLAPEPLMASGSDANTTPKEDSSTASEARATSDSAATTSTNEPASDPPGGRRSSRRAAAVVASVSAKSTTLTTTSNGETPPTSTETPMATGTASADANATHDTTASEKAESIAVSAKDAAAITEFVLSGGSMVAAASKFDITRTEVMRIVKEASADADTKSSSSTELESPESTDDQSNADATEKRRTSNDKRTTTDDDSTSTKPTQAEDTTVPVATGNVQAGSDVMMTEEAPEELGAPGSDLKRAASTDLSGDVIGGDASIPKAKRVRKTREEKLAILAFVDEGGTHVAAAEKFGVSRTAVTKMVKERDIIMSGLSGKPAVSTSAMAAVATSIPAATASMMAGAIALTVDASGGAAQVRKTSRVPGVASPSVAARSMPGSGTSTPTVGTPATNTKARRVRKTNEEKLLILEFVERGGSQGAAAEKFGVSRTAVTKMVKEKEAITAQVMSGKSNHRKVLQYQHKLSIIEDMLYKWQVQVENDAPNLKITGDLLQSKAVEFRDKILAEWKNSLEPEVVQSLSDFKASNGWLHRYLQRRNLRTASKRDYHRRPGAVESLSMSPSIMAASGGFNVNAFLEEVAHQLKAVPVDCIWNLDEMALLPTSLTAPSGGQGPQRMTVSLMVNAAGDRFKPQVVMQEADMARLGALQKSCPQLVLTGQGQLPHAWQDTTTLAQFMHALSLEAKSRVETWFLLMDASTSHLEFAHLVDPTGSLERGYRYENLVLFLLPPHAGSSDQYPLHQGVSRVFKAAYRQALLEVVVTKWQQWKKLSEETKAVKPFDIATQVDVTEQLELISRAWDTVPGPLVRHCWVRHGLLAASQLAHISQDNSRAIEGELFHALTESLALLRDLDAGALAEAVGLASLTLTAAATSNESAPSLIDHVNALIAFDDHEATERKPMELGGVASHVITETDANGDLRALV